MSPRRRSLARIEGSSSEVGCKEVGADEQHDDRARFERVPHLLAPLGPRLDPRVIPVVEMPRSLEWFEMHLQALQPLPIAVAGADEYASDFRPPAGP